MTTDIPPSRRFGETSRERIAVAAGAALLAAGLILVLFILPAEFAVDPLGIGARLGLMDLGETGQKVAAFESASSPTGATGTGQGAIVVPQEKAFQEETVEFKVAPHQGMEYKYRLDKGESLLYSWTATARVSFELHAEPDGAPAGYAQTYEKGDGADRASGTLAVPFSGIHGWYWENPGSDEVTVTLRSAGFYNMSHEFRKDVPVKTKMYQ